MRYDLAHECAPLFDFMGVGHPGLILFIGLVLISLVGLWRLLRHRPPTPEAAHPTSPRDLLDARYVRGEIDRASYLRIRTDLDTAPPD